MKKDVAIDKLFEVVNESIDRQKKILDICEGNTYIMGFAQIAAICLGCDFRDAEAKLKDWRGAQLGKEMGLAGNEAAKPQGGVR